MNKFLTRVFFKVLLVIFISNNLNAVSIVGLSFKEWEITFNVPLSRNLEIKDTTKTDGHKETLRTNVEENIEPFFSATLIGEEFYLFRSDFSLSPYFEIYRAEYVDQKLDSSNTHIKVPGVESRVASLGAILAYDVSKNSKLGIGLGYSYTSFDGGYYITDTKDSNFGKYVSVDLKKFGRSSGFFYQYKHNDYFYSRVTLVNVTISEGNYEYGQNNLTYIMAMRFDL